MTSEEDLIDRLSRKAAPIRPNRLRSILALQVLALSATLMMAAFWPGLRADLAAGAPAGQLVARELILGIAALCFMVGAAREGFPASWSPVPIRIGLGVLMFLPVMALVSLAGQDSGDPIRADAFAELRAWHHCFVSASVLALPSVAAQVWWIRTRGTSTAPRRAAGSIGLAAAGTGMLAYGLTCPSTHWLYAGTVYPLVILAVVTSARAGLAGILRW